jgi:hypothetical protein
MPIAFINLSILSHRDEERLFFTRCRRIPGFPLTALPNVTLLYYGPYRECGGRPGIRPNLGEEEISMARKEKKEIAKNYVGKVSNRYQGARRNHPWRVGE